MRENIIKETAVFLVVVLLLSVVILGGIQTLEEIGTEQVEQFCYVEDKHTDRRLIGKVFTTRHYIDVLVSDAEELRDSITVTGAFYSKVEVGDEIKCVLFYKNGKLLKIEIAE